MLVNLHNFIQNFILHVHHYRLFHVLFLHLYYCLQHSKQLTQIESHLIDLANDDLFVFLAMRVNLPTDEKLQELERLFVVGVAETVEQSLNHLVVLALFVVQLREKVIGVHVGVSTQGVDGVRKGGGFGKVGAE